MMTNRFYLRANLADFKESPLGTAGSLAKAHELPLLELNPFSADLIINLIIKY